MAVPLNVQSGHMMGRIQYNIMPNYPITNNKKNNGNNKGRNKKGGGGPGKSVTRNFRGITQSVAVSVNNAFGDTAKPQTVLKGLDAFDPSHVPLPCAVGDYTVIRTTEVFSGRNAITLLGPLKSGISSLSGNEERWSNICALQSKINNAGAYPIGDTNGTTKRVFSSLGGTAWSNARLVPAAFTVKIMNPEALQTTSGMVYVGRSKQMLNPGGDLRQWDTFANELISYSSPELCAAGRLALRGVKVDAVPYDMTSMSDFRGLDIETSGDFTWSNDRFQFDGFAPIFVYNPNQVNLQYMICCEWRVRFDPTNPAYATHNFHSPSTLGYWERVQRIGSALGNGVMDLTEKSAPQLLTNVAGSTSNRKLLLM